MNGGTDFEEGCSCSSAEVYEFMLHPGGSRVDRRGCHSDGCPSRQLLCLNSCRLRRRIEPRSLPDGTVGEASGHAARPLFGPRLRLDRRVGHYASDRWVWI
jgi:hypothetical protein